MAICTWQGSDTSWNTAGNWDNGVPGASDDAVFDGTSNQACILDVDAQTITSLTITSGHSGDLDLGDSGYDLAVTGDVTLDGTGTFDFGTVTITCSGNFDFRDQTTIVRGGSTVILDGSSKSIIASYSHDLNHLTISGDIALSADTSAYADIWGTLTIDEGASLTNDSNSDSVYVRGEAVVNGSLTGTSTGNNGIMGGNPLTIGANGIVDLGKIALTNCDVTIAEGGQLAPTTGVWTQFSSINGTPGIIKGTWTIQHQGGAARTFEVNDDVAFAGDVTVLADDADGFTLELNRDMEVRGALTFTEDGGTLTVSGGGAIVLGGHADQAISMAAAAIGTFKVTKSGGTVTSTGTIDIDSGHLLLVGTENNQCTLDGVDFDLASGVTGIVQNMKLQDCDITHADTGYLVPAALADNVVDLGGNTGFDFKKRTHAIL